MRMLLSISLPAGKLSLWGNEQAYLIMKDQEPLCYMPARPDYRGYEEAREKLFDLASTL